MRKIVVFNMVSVDGYFAGPHGEIDWHNVDAEFNSAYAIPMLENASMFLFGRVTYDLMAGYWPKEEAVKGDPIVADKMNSLPKLVFSKSIDKSDWANTTFMPEIDGAEILKLKQQPGKDMLVLGSGTLVQALTNLGLIDEYRLMVNPVVLGNGKQMFAGVSQRKLKLLRTQQFASGNVLLCYT